MFLNRSTVAAFESSFAGSIMLINLNVVTSLGGRLSPEDNPEATHRPASGESVFGTTTLTRKRCLPCRIGWGLASLNRLMIIEIYKIVEVSMMTGEEIK